jgi:hypothetical protein
MSGLAENKELQFTLLSYKFAGEIVRNAYTEGVAKGIALQQLS